MAKYYVQSGIYREVIQADDARKAALWAIHQVMQDVLPVYDDRSLDMQQKHQVAVLQACLVLDEEVRVNERGFDRFDGPRFRASRLVDEWHQLIVAIDKLEQEFSVPAPRRLPNQSRKSRITSNSSQREKCPKSKRGA
jgi:hypothetical protein